ncbi:hypothetical protein LbFV_ORF33 [Leptopilina boulardi filamentous virus]|uniref:Uncharacterized protein n=1 Tax=Leptopilina boulardi filamentous virus TaxID=552509 RepID=A0A1S5YD29_9VIRU|nr:hypothetical protein LbFV_ORF33 [Leptopilina boulardi filamentous virus]AQQ79953.1 hypothetical protein LbFV_ORF33 [Leptopilina boulardi filamentous virus]
MNLKYLLSQTPIRDNILFYIPHRKNLSSVCRDFRYMYYEMNAMVLKEKNMLDYFKNVNALSITINDEKDQRFGNQIALKGKSLKSLKIHLSTKFSFNFLERMSNLSELILTEDYYYYRNSESILDLNFLPKSLKKFHYNSEHYKNFSALKKLNLEYLHLRQKKILNENDFSLPSTLKHLHFTSHNYSIQLSFSLLHNLENLTYLSVQNFYGSLSFLSTRIKKLELSNCMIDDYSGLSQLINLDRLQFVGLCEENSVEKEIIFPLNVKYITLHLNEIHCYYNFKNSINIKRLLFQIPSDYYQKLLYPNFIHEVHLPYIDDDNYEILQNLYCNTINIHYQNTFTNRLMSYINPDYIEQIRCERIGVYDLSNFKKLKLLAIKRFPYYTLKYPKSLCDVVYG